jgi:succinyldiaminopimelate transaminase
MLNPNLDHLADYPFDRLRALLADIDPPAGVTQRVLSVGEPRHAPPSLLADIISADNTLWGRYPPVDGTPDFRKAVAEWLTRRYRLDPAELDPDRHVLPVSGTREALFLAANLGVAMRGDRRRDAVLMPNPFYQVYFGAAVMHGAEPVYLPATAETGFLPDLDTLPGDLLDRTAVFFLCTPANPQGAVADADYLRRAIALAQRHDFILCVDECYAEIYDKTPPPGALEVVEPADDRWRNVLVFHSLSKRSSVPGLRSGFVAGDPTLISAFRRLRSFAGATLPLPILAASAALWRDEAHVEANRSLYRQKFDLADHLIGDRFGYMRPPGGFFLWLNVGDGEAAATALWRDGAIRVLPGAYLAKTCGTSANASSNPGAPYIRVALIDDLQSTEDTLRRLINIL